MGSTGQKGGAKENLTYHIRPAGAADAKAILEFIAPILGEYGYAPDVSTSESDLIDLEKTDLQSGGWFHIVESQQKEMVGTIGFFPIAPGVGRIRKMYIRSDLRSQGLGKQLILDTLLKAKKLGFEAIILETTHSMKEAIAFIAT